MKSDAESSTRVDVTMTNVMHVWKYCSSVKLEAQMKRIDGDWKLRYVWAVQLFEQSADLILSSKKLESKWAGFNTRKDCIADMCSVVSTWIRLNAIAKPKKSKKNKK